MNQFENLLQNQEPTFIWSSSKSAAPRRFVLADRRMALPLGVLRVGAVCTKASADHTLLPAVLTKIGRCMAPPIDVLRRAPSAQAALSRLQNQGDHCLQCILAPHHYAAVDATRCFLFCSFVAS